MGGLPLDPEHGAAREKDVRVFAKYQGGVIPHWRSVE